MEGDHLVGRGEVDGKRRPLGHEVRDGADVVEVRVRERHEGRGQTLLGEERGQAGGICARIDDPCGAWIVPQYNAVGLDGPQRQYFFVHVIPRLCSVLGVRPSC